MQNSSIRRVETSSSSPRRSRGGSAVDFDLENKRLKVEVEHLKNTLIGLNEKLTVFNDLKKDLEQSRQMLNDSEMHREQLQDHADKTAQLSR